MCWQGLSCFLLVREGEAAAGRDGSLPHAERNHGPNLSVGSMIFVKCARGNRNPAVLPNPLHKQLCPERRPAVDPPGQSARGFEPPHPFGHWHLKPARLPFRHSRECQIRPTVAYLREELTTRRRCRRASRSADATAVDRCVGAPAGGQQLWNLGDEFGEWFAEAVGFESGLVGEPLVQPDHVFIVRVECDDKASVFGSLARRSA